MLSVMEYISRGELFAAWCHCENFSESLVKLHIAELAIVLGMTFHCLSGSLLLNLYETSQIEVRCKSSM